MKKFVVLPIFLFLSSITYTQTYNKTVFITGYPRTDLWEGVENYLNSTFYLNTYKASISVANSNIDLHNQLSGNQWIGIGHSRGGVVTRDYKRQYGANAKINRVITIGSPHLGANILVNVENGNIAYLASWGLTQVSKGPLFSLGYPAAIPTLNYTFSQLVPIVTNIAYVESGYSALAHLKPGSSYLTTLNNTSETFQRAGIYGAEYWHRPIRTIGSFLGNENGWVNGWNTGVNIYYSVSYVYAWYFYYYYDLFIYYLNHFQYIPQLLYTALYYANASNLWYDGFLTTYYYFDAIYDIYLGVPYIVSNGIPYLQSGSDGIISIPSQKYPNVTSDWNYMAEGANHAEERSNNNVAFRSRDILDRWGIQRR